MRIRLGIVCLTAIVGLLLGACVTGTNEKGHSYYVYKNAKGQEILTPLPCGNAVDPCNETMKDAKVTNDPSDEEFWQFEARVMVRALIGIPYGRMPQDFNVIGTQARCEAVRAGVNDPTEPCQGPFYFRRAAASMSDGRGVQESLSGRKCTSPLPSSCPP
jgi:hypothetical protein